MSKSIKIIFLFIFIITTFYLLSDTLSYYKVSAQTPGFVKTPIVSNLNFPTDFVLTPDGRIFISEQYGQIKVFKNGNVLPNPLITLDVSTQGEQGILGITLDPDFSSNHFVYIDYVNKNPLEIRVSRFELKGDTLNPSSEKVLLRSTQSLGFIHHGGTIRFGKDGKLWISVGNNGIASNAQDLSNIHGKILRINKDGTIPSDNPFFNQSGKAQSIWLYGLRNPFRFNFLLDGRIIIGDVGDDSWEEINIGVKGGNFGYPPEGACSSCSSINPVYQYSHNGGSAAVVGGFQYNGNTLPPEYKYNFFYGDYSLGFIKRLVLDQNGNFVSNQSFFDDAGSVVEILPGGVDGTFYFLTIFPGNLYKVELPTGNKPPIPKASASPVQGDVPLKVNFSGKGSSDPEGTKLKFKWDFGDSTSSTKSNPSHQYKNKGVYHAVLTVSDGKLSQSSPPIQILVGIKNPTAEITKPEQGSKYNAGDTISFEGKAQDAQDGVLENSAYSWDILFHHQNHPHPFLSNIKGVKNGEFKIADTGESSAETFYEIKLTVTNSLGLKTVVSRNISPNVVDLNLDSTPPGLTLLLDGIPVVTPYSTKGVVGFKRFLDINSPQSLNEQNYQFESWSDNGSKAHQITTPNVSTTYKATFNDVGAGMGNLRFRITEFNSSFSWTGKYLNGVTAKLTDTSGTSVFATLNSAKRTDGEDGWVEFNGIQAGTYGILAYNQNYQGVWKKLNCQNSQGTFSNAVIQNINTQNFKAAWNNNVTLSAGQTTFCTDLGLQPNNIGDLRFRILEATKNSAGYTITGYLNDVNVKLTDTSGNVVIQALTSKTRTDGEVGWVEFNNIPSGTYGIMAFKNGYTGFLKKINCSIESTDNTTIKNDNTEGLVAAWNPNTQVVGGKVTYCYDLGLVKDSTSRNGNIYIRVAEFGVDNSWKNTFLNGASVKLTDTNGNSVFRTSSSANAFGNEAGWVFFDNISAGTYGVLGYKEGFVGFWKKLDCQNSTGTSENASILNGNTNGLTAAWNNHVIISANQTTWCTDLGLKPNK